MKKTIILIFVVVQIILFTSCEQNSAVIRGTFQSEDTTLLAIGDLVLKEHLDTIQVIDGQFNHQIDIPYPGYYMFAVGNNIKQLFLAPGYDLDFTISQKTNEVQTIFKGKGEAENKILLEIIKKMEQIDYPYLEKIETVKIIPYIDSIFNGFRSSFEKMIKGKKLDPRFVNFQNRYIDFKAATLKTILGLQNNIREKSYYTFIETLELENPQYLGIPDFRWFLEYYTEKMLDEKLSSIPEQQHSNPQTWIKAKFAVIETFENEKIKEFLTFSTIKQIIEYEGIDGFEYCRDSYNKHLKHDNYRDQIRIILNKKASLAKGKPAPEITVYNQNNKEVHLSDFKGRFVYIDFWATWCKPCKEESPHFKALSKEYSQKDIVFIAISLDDAHNFNIWKEMIQDDKTIIHLRSQNGWTSEIVDSYQISGVPTYVFIDREGMIIDATAPRPSSHEMKVLLNQFLSPQK